MQSKLSAHRAVLADDIIIAVGMKDDLQYPNSFAYFLSQYFQLDTITSIFADAPASMSSSSEDMLPVRIVKDAEVIDVNESDFFIFSGVLSTGRTCAAP